MLVTIADRETTTDTDMFIASCPLPLCGLYKRRRSHTCPFTTLISSHRPFSLSPTLKNTSSCVINHAWTTAIQFDNVNMQYLSTAATSNVVFS